MSYHELTIRFPSGCGLTAEAVPEDQLQRFPEQTQKRLAVLNVSYGPETSAFVYGFGREFANPDHASDRWFNNGEVMVAGMTLQEFVSQSEFKIVVGACNGPTHFTNLLRASPPTPFCYPYGRDHHWDTYRYTTQRSVMQGSQFAGRQAFVDENEHVAVLTQQVAQDTVWTAFEAAEIFSQKFPAYFVPVSDNSDDCKAYYAIVRLPEGYSDQWQSWSQFTTADSRIGLALHTDGKEMDAPSIEDVASWKKMARSVWLATIVDAPAIVSKLQEHPVEEGEMVLFVRRDSDTPVFAYQSRDQANAALARDPASQNWVSLMFDPGLDEAQRKVEAVCQLLPDALPTGLGPEDPEKLPFHMQLHRELWCGASFWRSLAQSQADNIVSGTASMSLDDRKSPARALPRVDLTGGMDDRHMVALMEHIHEDERARFGKYMANRPLGLAMVTAVSAHFLPNM